MKAIVQTGYGSPDVFQLREIEMPVIDDDGVLVRVQAASVNALDWHLMRGIPAIIRLTTGLRRPKSPVPGVDVAGGVRIVGRGGGPLPGRGDRRGPSDGLHPRGLRRGRAAVRPDLRCGMDPFIVRLPARAHSEWDSCPGWTIEP